MLRAYIGAGSNIRPRRNIAAALCLLSRLVTVAGVSTVYRTAPEGGRRQPDYYNCVIAIKTNLAPRALKYRILSAIERALGRARTSDRYASRTIDLDLIAYDSLRLQTADLVLPDPAIQERAYLAAGLEELKNGTAPRRGTARMKPLRAYTAYLRKELKQWSRISKKLKS